MIDSTGKNKSIQHERGMQSKNAEVTAPRWRRLLPLPFR
jgi:hypothetical protein